MASNPESVLDKSRELSALLTRLEENLTKSQDKNDALLEAIETAETRALDMSASASELSLLRNLRARLAASHAPNAELKNDLPILIKSFKEKFQSLDLTLKQYKELTIKLQQDDKDMKEQQDKLNKEREIFNEEREKWQRHIEQARNDISEQNDRLTFLSQQLTGTKAELDLKTNELASRRIAFEEEKLLQQSGKGGGRVVEGEAEELRQRLRNQALKNVELETALLRTEVSLHQKVEDYGALELKNKRLSQEVEQLRTASSKAVKQFEKRTIEANKQLSFMNSELSKAQDNAKRFQEILSVEKRKQKALQHALDERQSLRGGDHVTGLSHGAQKAYIETLSEAIQTVGKKPHSNMRVQDLIRKNEAVLVENAHLKATVQKLRAENDELMRHARIADCNAHHMRNQVLTNLHDRADLMKRLDKAEQQHKEMQLSLTRQASDWIQHMKTEKQKEKEKQMIQIQPVSTLAASERTWIKGPSKTPSLSREIQVHKW